jgi:hypothetical protein
MYRRLLCIHDRMCFQLPKRLPQEQRAAHPQGTGSTPTLNPTFSARCPWRYSASPASTLPSAASAPWAGPPGGGGGRKSMPPSCCAHLRCGKCSSYATPDLGHVTWSSQLTASAEQALLQWPHPLHITVHSMGPVLPHDNKL